MPRRRYPSDDARLTTRPHVKIALDIAHHPRTAEVWADPESRGMLTELLRIAAASWAGRRGGEVALSRADLTAIAGRTQHAHNLRALRALCARVAYPVSERGALLVVTVENFKENQGYSSASRGLIPRTPSASDSEAEADTDSERERSESGRAAETRHDPGAKRPACDAKPPTPKSESGAPPAGGPPALDSERLVLLLAKEPGSDAAKLEWLRNELPLIALKADEDHPDDERRRMAAVRSRVVRHWRQHCRRPQAQAGHAPPAPGSKADRRELARRLYTVEDLLPDDTLEALAEWERRGSPRQVGWWLPPEEAERMRAARAARSATRSTQGSAHVAA